MLRSLFRGINRCNFSQKISIFKKKPVITPLDTPYTKSVDEFRNKALDIGEIMDFDLYYQDFKFQASNRLESNPKKFQSKLKTAIFEILDQKTEKNNDKLAFFLENRGEKLTEIEILYALQRIIDAGMVKQFKLVNTKLYISILEAIKKMEVKNIDAIQEFFFFFRAFQVEDQELLDKMLVNLTSWTNKMEEKTGSIEEINNVFGAFIIMLEVYTVDNAQKTEKVLKVLKFIMKNYRSLELLKLKELLVKLNQANIVINLNYLSDLDTLFTEHKSSFTSSDAIDILYIFAKNKLPTPFFLSFFTEIKDFPKWIASASSHEFSTFVWTLSQIDHSVVSENFFKAIEMVLLENFVKNPEKFTKNDMRSIVQSLHHADKGSKEFWGYFNDVKKLAFLGLTLNELLAILLSQIRFKILESKLLDFFFMQLDSEEKIEFIQEVSPQQCLRIFELTVFGFHKLSNDNSFMKTSDKFSDYLNTLSEMCEEVYDKFFSEKVVYQTLEIKETLALYKLLNLATRILSRGDISEDQDLYTAMEKLSKRILRKVETIAPEDYGKTLVFLDYILNSEEDISLKLLARMEERIRDVFAVNPGKLLHLIPFLSKYKIKRERLWGLIQIALIEYLPGFNLDEIMASVVIFDQLEKEKIIKRNQSFWEYIFVIFHQGELNVELARVLNGKIEMGTFKKSIEEKNKKFGVNLEELIQETTKNNDVEDSMQETKEKKEKNDLNQTEQLLELFV